MNRFNSFSTSLLLLLLCLAHKSVTAEDNAKALAAPTEGNAVETEEQIVVTLGPPRDGIQRALIDEVEGNKIAILPSLDDKGRVRPGDLDGYDDNFVELREEEPIFIPRPYRNETTTTTTTTTTTPQPTTARTRPPVQKPQQPVQSQRQPQPFRPNQIVQPRPQPQLQPQPNLQPQFRPQPPQPPPFVQPQQPVQSRPVVPQRLQPQPQPQRPQPNTIVQPQQPFVPTPQQQQTVSQQLTQQQQQNPFATEQTQTRITGHIDGRGQNVGAQTSNDIIRITGYLGNREKPQTQVETQTDQIQQNRIQRITLPSPSQTTAIPQKRNDPVEQRLMAQLNELERLREQSNKLRDEERLLQQQKLAIREEQVKQLQRIRLLKKQRNQLLRQQKKLMRAHHQMHPRAPPGKTHRPSPPKSPSHRIFTSDQETRSQQHRHTSTNHSSQQQQRPTATLPPAFPTVPQFPVNQRPVRPRPQPPHSPPRVALPSRTTGQTTAPNLRTGVCHASIFYISSPLETRSRLTFTHFAIAVSVDQCARTCHEFNCAIAHFDPANGHCQFNPSTAFAVREGQCPRWPSAHYRNNVMTQGAIRIFCVQCHRPFRRGRGRSHGGRFRTRIVQPQFTGRLTSALARSAKISSKRISLDDSSLLNGRDDNDHNYESTNIRNIHQPTNNTKWDAEKDERLEVDINELERKVIEMTRKNEGGIQHSLKSSAIVREQHSAETSADESENL